MEDIAQYSSSDVDTSSECEPAAEARRCEQVQLPGTATVLPSQHEDTHRGRVRSFPHIEGAFAVHVYIPIDVSESDLKRLNIILHSLIAQVPSLEFMERPYHLSLSHATPASIHQVASLVPNLRKSLKKLSLTTLLVWEKGTRLQVLVNKERTRTFLALPVTTVEGGDDILKRAISAVNWAFKLHGLPEYHRDPIPHISIAWLLGDQSVLLEKMITAMRKDSEVSWRCPQTHIMCRCGNKVYKVL